MADPRRSAPCPACGRLARFRRDGTPVYHERLGTPEPCGDRRLAKRRALAEKPPLAEVIASAICGAPADPGDLVERDADGVWRQRFALGAFASARAPGRRARHQARAERAAQVLAAVEVRLLRGEHGADVAQALGVRATLVWKVQFGLSSRGLLPRRPAA